MTLQLWERSSHFFFLLRVGARYRVGGRGRACPKEKKKKRRRKKKGAAHLSEDDLGGSVVPVVVEQFRHVVVHGQEEGECFVPLLKSLILPTTPARWRGP